jgi:curli biogenesis system outer membrane secretion channel CsgG
MRVCRRVVFTAAPVLTVLLAGCVTPIVYPAKPLPRDAVPPTIAVNSFENRSGFAGQWKIGSGMADLLVSELVKSKNFVVVERTYLDSVVGEIARQKNRLFRPEGRVNEGRLRNARYLIRGVVNDFSQVGGGAVEVAMRKFLFGGRGHTARVSMTLTIVDIESGEIVDSVQCAAKVRAREAYASGVYSDVAFGGDKFFKTPLGTATVNAIRRGVRELTRRVPRVMWEPRVAALVDDRVVLNGGSDRGFGVGQTYEVREEGRPVTDPVTGDLLDVIAGSTVAKIRVTEVEERISYADVVWGAEVRRGQKLVLSEPSP